jgi:hypothetical protein
MRAELAEEFLDGTVPQSVAPSGTLDRPGSHVHASR